MIETDIKEYAGHFRTPHIYPEGLTFILGFTLGSDGMKVYLLISMYLSLGSRVRTSVV